MSGTRAISTTSRRELSSSFFFFLQGKAPKEIHAILTETLAFFRPGRVKDLSAHLYLKHFTSPIAEKIFLHDALWSPALQRKGYYCRNFEGRTMCPLNHHNSILLQENGKKLTGGRGISWDIGESVQILWGWGEVVLFWEVGCSALAGSYSGRGGGTFFFCY